ncbi:MAG: NUDIX hydrolase [Prevotella sp.]|nr:NUDIX hydrolase [Staphylococcus sp.]MCM1349930.1 NUDIX hydrolase [Prevotella sp.]
MSIEKSISEKVIFNGKIVQLVLRDVLLPNGNVARREIVHHQKAVAIVAFDGSHILMVQQYRTAVGKYMLEIPAGLLEANEDALVCAHRELQEETGYDAKQMELLCSFYPSCGFTDEETYIYLATDLYESKLPEDEDEFIELTKLPLPSIPTFLSQNDTLDGKTALGLSLFALWRQKKNL